jgi:hypothetical protein
MVDLAKLCRFLDSVKLSELMQRNRQDAHVCAVLFKSYNDLLAEIQPKLAFGSQDWEFSITSI